MEARTVVEARLSWKRGAAAAADRQLSGQSAELDILSLETLLVFGRMERDS